MGVGVVGVPFVPASTWCIGRSTQLDRGVWLYVEQDVLAAAASCVNIPMSACPAQPLALICLQDGVDKCSYPGCDDKDCSGNRIEVHRDARTGTRQVQVILPHHKNARR